MTQIVGNAYLRRLQSLHNITPQTYTVPSSHANLLSELQNVKLENKLIRTYSIYLSAVYYHAYTVIPIENINSIVQHV